MIKDADILKAITPDMMIMVMYNDRRSEYHGLRSCQCFTPGDFDITAQPFYYDGMEIKAGIDRHNAPVIILSESDDIRNHTANW